MNHPGRGGRRNAPTLDLSAQELGRDPGSGGMGQAAPFGTEQADAAPQPGPADEGVGAPAEPDGVAPVPPSAAGAERRRRVWPAVLLSGLLGGAAGAGGVVWLDRAGHLPLAGTAGIDPGGGAVSGEIAALRSEVDELRQAQGETGTSATQAEAVERLRQQVAALEQTVGELSRRPAGASDPAAVGAIEARLAEVEARGGQPGADLEPIEERLAALEARGGQPGADLAPIEERLAALENRPAAPGGADLGPLEARLAELETRLDQARAAGTDPALESRIAELETRLARAVPPEAIGGLETRLNEIAGQVQEVRDRPPVDLSGIQADVADLRTRLDELGNWLGAVPTQEQVAGLEAAVGKAATAEQLAGLEAQLAALPKEERVAGLETALAETRTQADKGASLGPAITANALTSALAAGAPYRAELDALRALGLDPAALEGLAAHADNGLPTIPELRAGFDQAVANVDLSQPIPESAGAVNRLLQSARSLVEVRAAGPATGTDPAAIAGRLRSALDTGDLRAALAEWQALPEQAKASTGDWARLAQARADAEDLAARLRTEALSRIAAGG